MRELSPSSSSTVAAELHVRAESIPFSEAEIRRQQGHLVLAKGQAPSKRAHLEVRAPQSWKGKQDCTATRTRMRFETRVSLVKNLAPIVGWAVTPRGRQ